MSLPVSQYEDLLAEVRGLRREAQHVQQLANPLISNLASSSSIFKSKLPIQQDGIVNPTFDYTNMEPILAGKQYNTTTINNFDGASSSNSANAESEDECGSARNAHMSVSSEPSISQRNKNVSMLYHGTWPVENTMWNSEPANLKGTNPPIYNHHLQDVTSVMSFASSSGGVPLDRVLGSPNLSRRSSQQLEAKVDMVYSLLAMLSGQEHADMGETLLALSTNPESCLAMRQSGCIPLLVQMVQSDKEQEARVKASQAIHNLIHSQPDEKIRKREIRIFKLLEQTRAYTEALKNDKLQELEVTPSSSASSSSEDGDKHPVQTVAHVMKLSFDEGHRQAICQLGGIHTIANLVEAEHVAHGSTNDEAHCILMRRYACMALTNLTFGDSGNKALLCSLREFIRALVVQLQSPSDELRQVTASVLRNLSWRADSSSKEILREVGSVTGLIMSAMLDNKENTLKSILSALWNLSAHCTENKSEICSVDGALRFLVQMLTYKSPSKSLTIVENSGGILRNISSQIAVRDDYREVLRLNNCLQILLDQLKSPSLTIVSNACGTLWNLSAKCVQDQEILLQLGAPSMLRSLNHSKHKMIAMGSSAALKNLISARPSQSLSAPLDSIALSLDLPALPTLGARKQKALLHDLDQMLSETYENIEKDSPVKQLPVAGSNGTSSKHDFLEKSQKNRFNQTETADYLQFTSLDVNEPSTSSSSQQVLHQPTSLPYFETSNKSSIPVRSCDVPTNFVKSMPKSVAKKCVKSSSKARNSEKSTASSLQHSSCISGDDAIDISGSFDNDKPKNKEITSHLDEKDHCSIEDVSDGDVIDNSLDEVKFEQVVEKYQAPPLHYPKSPVYLDEIDMEEISIQILSETETLPEDCMEKQDTGKEKHSRQNSGSGTNSVDSGIQSKRDTPVVTPRQIPQRSTIPKIHTSSIPLPRTFSTSKSSQSSTPSSIIDLQSSSGDSTNFTEKRAVLPTKRNLPTSTPIKLDTNCGNPNLEEVAQMQGDVNIDREVSQMRRCPVEKDPMLSGNLQGTCQNFNCFSDPSVSRIEQATTFNISQENNSSQMEEVSLPKSDSGNSVAPRVVSIDEPTVPDLDPSVPSVEKVEFHVSPSECLNPEVEADRLLERSCEGTSKIVDNRMLDPDAMIESLDRFTAELVSQASHLQQSNEDKKPNDNTWNEDTSPNEVTFPSISGSGPNVITFDSNGDGDVSNQIIPENKSNDFSSMNTSTMTQSTLIAIEASKMATVFKNEAEMSISATSLEFDQPKSTESGRISRPKSRKKSLPHGLMVRRALSNSQNNGSSLESLDNHSLSNLDQVNPPSLLGEVLDMEGSMTSVASLPSENGDVGNGAKPDFVINGSCNRNYNGRQQPLSLMTNAWHLSSLATVTSTDLDNINPPSLFNEITDMCNSLADVASEAIGSETEVFEDCFTHVADPTVQTADDVTEFSDANSVTPIQSDTSTPETSPKRCQNKSSGNSACNNNKQMMTSKQKRNLARDRYKTYTVAAEMIVKEEEKKLKAVSSIATDSTSDDFKTVDCISNDFKSVDESEETTYVSPTYSVQKEDSSSKLTPKDRRRLDRTRFETQVLTESTVEIHHHPPSEVDSPPDAAPQSPARTRLSIRRNFMQKRFENRDRFKTQTLNESSFSDSPSASPPPLSAGEQDLHFLVQKEANLVLKSLRETKTSGGDDLLECETLSLVSNDDDSEQNSASSVNYRTYHKSWGLKKNVPVVNNKPSDVQKGEIPQLEDQVLPENGSDEENEQNKNPAKPKITKPGENKPELEEGEPEQQSPGKGIRGRRKPLYTKSTIGNKITPKSLKPFKTMTSNLVKNVTSTFKSTSGVQSKPPLHQSRTDKNKATPLLKVVPKSNLRLPQKVVSSKIAGLERQGTFTKDEVPLSGAVTSKIPAPGFAKKFMLPPSKIPSKENGNKLLGSQPKSSPTKSSSTDRANRNIKPSYARSTSADSRDTSSAMRKIQGSSSSQSLKSHSGAVKKSAIPQVSQRSNSNTSLNSNGPALSVAAATTVAAASNNTARKQVTSKIASLWKKIEDSKKLQQPVKKDTRVWIGATEPPAALGRSNNKDEVTLRNKPGRDEDPSKRVSRLGSFVVMDETEDGVHLQPVVGAEAT